MSGSVRATLLLHLVLSHGEERHSSLALSVCWGAVVPAAARGWPGHAGTTARPARIRRDEVTIRVAALGNDGLAVNEDHGLVRLSDDELELGRVWVAKKCGIPIIVTRLPIGEGQAKK